MYVLTDVNQPPPTSRQKNSRQAVTATKTSRQKEMLLSAAPWWLSWISDTSEGAQSLAAKFYIGWLDLSCICLLGWFLDWFLISCFCLFRWHQFFHISFSASFGASAGFSSAAFAFSAGFVSSAFPQQPSTFNLQPILTPLSDAFGASAGFSSAAFVS